MSVKGEAPSRQPAGCRRYNGVKELGTDALCPSVGEFSNDVVAADLDNFPGQQANNVAAAQHTFDDFALTGAKLFYAEALLGFAMQA